MSGGAFGKLAKGSVGDAFEVPEVEGVGGGADDKSGMKLEACEAGAILLLTRIDQILSSICSGLREYRWIVGFRATQWV